MSNDFVIVNTNSSDNNVSVPAKQISSTVEIDCSSASAGVTSVTIEFVDLFASDTIYLSGCTNNIDVNLPSDSDLMLLFGNPQDGDTKTWKLVVAGTGATINLGTTSVGIGTAGLFVVQIDDASTGSVKTTAITGGTGSAAQPNGGEQTITAGTVGTLAVNFLRPSSSQYGYNQIVVTNTTGSSGGFRMPKPSDMISIIYSTGWFQPIIYEFILDGTNNGSDLYVFDSSDGKIAMSSSGIASGTSGVNVPVVGIPAGVDYIGPINQNETHVVTLLFNSATTAVMQIASTSIISS